MFKKSIMMLIVIAIVATFSMIPAAALDESALFFDVDFDTQDVADAVGNFTFEEFESVMGAADLTFEYDEEIQRNVLVWGGDGVLCWSHKDGAAGTLNGMDLAAEGLTLEVYVWMSEDAGNVNQVILETNDSAVHLQEYNDGTDLCSGFRAGDGDGGPSGVAASNAYIDATFPHGQWIHLVGTTDGATNDLYINGAHRASYTRGSSALSNAHNSTGSSVYIGESYLGSMWGATAFYGKIAFARIYKSAADADAVAARYEEVTGLEAEEGGDVVAATPAPTAPPVEENTTTFDLGLVSLAAVALSSVVAIKKRR